MHYLSLGKSILHYLFIYLSIYVEGKPEDNIVSEEQLAKLTDFVAFLEN